MFQVDRGKTFAKSFKEFVGNAWRGDGYLSGSGQNLKPYYWQENGDNIRNRDGIVFSDEYHVNSEGDPAYYMNLIMEAFRKLDLISVVMAVLKKMAVTMRKLVTHPVLSHHLLILCVQ